MDQVVGNLAPNFLISDPVAGDLVVLDTVEIEGDTLIPPVSGCSIDNRSVGVEILTRIRKSGRTSDTIILVADAIGVLVTMDNALGLGFTVDVFHDIDLATGRPDESSLSVTITEKPKCGPDTLLTRWRSTTQPNRCFGDVTVEILVPVLHDPFGSVRKRAGRTLKGVLPDDVEAVIGRSTGGYYP
ncbi:hypothetical protein HG531_000952 [Fusarium graminearum]|nr:hypothetical protein HG531_000952 [Fusarium graminearum]